MTPRRFGPSKGPFRPSLALGRGLFTPQQFVLPQGGRLAAVKRDEQVPFAARLPSGAGRG
ncbi:hypothetical protein CSC68_15700 [Pseudoxanthomonas suwonensis]|nr:hypothetical protein CSC68_15700 [Pseudoxanthomonas suwonensis]